MSTMHACADCMGDGPTIKPILRTCCDESVSRFYRGYWLSIHFALFLKPLRRAVNIGGQYDDKGELAKSSSTDANVLSNILVPSAA
ncbi:hypothetical protein [Paraburkholderia caffeinilytica]|uniref:hypothetical protein n=1 Tax=Paraburkholderia caffeinilytica TaxID=1761016 RepID=UPI0038BBED56